MSKIIVFATPVFLLLIALEYAWSRRRAPAAYRFSDSLNSLSLGLLSQLVAVLGTFLFIGIYSAVFDTVGAQHTVPFWDTVAGVVVALLFYDLCYYWLHRASHRVAVLWAAHVVHHQSQHYNLTTALRQTGSGLLLGWIFYLPLALAGVPPRIFALVAMVDLLYQFWVHTEQVGRLGWFDRVFCSPSNHRVHHAVNDAYIDKNYGGILILWDRLFGSFQEEGETCVYGTRSPLNSWDPLWANLEVYWTLAQDSWRTRRWRDKLRLWFMPPGWQPDDLARTQPKPAFTLQGVRLFNPPLGRGQQWVAGAQFLLLLTALSGLLWFADALPWAQTAIWALAITTGTWGLGLYLQQRLCLLELLALDSAVLATLSGCDLLGLHLLFKPMTMVITIIFVARYALSMRPTDRFGTWLLAALAWSLLGDVWLMLPGDYFIPGLASFLLAHLCYLRLFRIGQAWFPDRRALAAVLAVAAAVFAVLWTHLPGAILTAAVAVYVCAIALMTAQALGRARVLNQPGARWVALGACVFMLSDTCIAINKFLQPLPWPQLWILASYYLAQLLLAHHARSAAPAPDPAA